MNPKGLTIMDPIIKARWTTALRSGDYTQGHGALRPVLLDGTVTDCCLGVLCEIAAEEGKVTWQVDSPDEYDEYDDGDNEPVNSYCEPTDDESGIGDDGVLPIAVARWAGLIDPSTEEALTNPNVEVDGEPYTLSHLNDHGLGGPRQHPTERKPLTFDQIADLIEQQL